MPGCDGEPGGAVGEVGQCAAVEAGEQAVELGVVWGGEPATALVRFDQPEAERAEARGAAGLGEYGFQTLRIEHGSTLGSAAWDSQRAHVRAAAAKGGL